MSPHTRPRAASKQDRIVEATRELLLRHGFRGVTVAEVAKRAQVGKGTVYLYWPTKDDLVLELFTREHLHAVGRLVDALAADPATVLPRNLFPLMQRIAVDQPFVRALRTADLELLGLITGHPRATTMLRALDPGVVVASILPVLREHRIVRTDLPAEAQAYAAHAVASGFLGLATGVFPPGGPAVADREPATALADTMRLLLEPAEPADGAAVAAAAAAVRSLVAAVRDGLRPEAAR